MEVPSQPVLSKKRHMGGKESRSGVSRRSDELPQTRNVSGVVSQPATSRPSFDSISLPGAGLHHQDSYPPGAQDMLPMDLGSRATTDSASTGAGSVLQQAAYAGGNPAVSSPSTLNRLGALMFPSEDPFAYPNQPMMELGLQQKMQQEPMQGQGQGAAEDNAQFFMQGTFDDVESHLLGQIPPFMIDQAHQGLEMPVNMYSSGMASSSVPAPVPSQGPRGQGRSGVQGGHMERERMEQLRRQQEQILAAQRYRDWGQYGRGNYQM